MPRRLTFAAALTAAAGAANPAGAQPLGSDDPGFAAWLRSATDGRGRPCSPLGERREASRVFVACGPTGVWEVSLEASGPRLVETYPTEGEAIGFVEETGGTVWVKIRSTLARPLDELARAARASEAPQPLPAPAPVVPPPPAAVLLPAPPGLPPPGAPPLPPVGRVVSVDGRYVVIALGTSHGVGPGMRIELSRRREERLAGGEAAVFKDVLAVGIVEEAAAAASKVRLGVNEQVTLDAVGEPTMAPVSSSLTGPPRMGDFWSAHFIARPFVAIGQLGGGVLLSAAIGYRFASNFHLEAQVDPLGVADAENDRAVTSGVGYVMASYDSQFLEIGAGLGGQSMNAPAFGLAAGSGFAVAQLIRLGALDGLSLYARSSVVLFHRESVFGGLDMRGQIPMKHGYWLILGGGGGDAGYGYGEIGLRALVDGNGEPGSTFVTATGGGATLFEDPTCDGGTFDFRCTDGADYSGPMVGFGLERRF